MRSQHWLVWFAADERSHHQQVLLQWHAQPVPVDTAGFKATDLAC
jgi:hypothetical protein